MTFKMTIPYKKIDMAEMNEFIEAELKLFNEKRIEKLKKTKLNDVLRRKNPYLYKAKGLEIAGDFVKAILDAALSSQEETLFGTTLERIAIKACNLAKDGRKSNAVGIDLEFEDDKCRYLVAVKSGPNWGNSSSIKKMVDYFKKAKKIFKTNNDTNEYKVVCINGCCYGTEANPDKIDYYKLCGQDFWMFLTGEKDFYLSIIEPLGHKVKERSEDFTKQYNAIVNEFTQKFSKEYVTDGRINWESLVKLVSAPKPPKKEE